MSKRGVFAGLMLVGIIVAVFVVGLKLGAKWASEDRDDDATEARIENPPLLTGTPQQPRPAAQSAIKRELPRFQTTSSQQRAFEDGLVIAVRMREEAQQKFNKEAPNNPIRASDELQKTLGAISAKFNAPTAIDRWQCQIVQIGGPPIMGLTMADETEYLLCVTNIKYFLKFQNPRVARDWLKQLNVGDTIEFDGDPGGEIPGPILDKLDIFGTGIGEAADGARFVMVRRASGGKPVTEYQTPVRGQPGDPYIPFSPGPRTEDQPGSRWPTARPEPQMQGPMSPRQR